MTCTFTNTYTVYSSGSCEWRMNGGALETCAETVRGGKGPLNVPFDNKESAICPVDIFHFEDHRIRPTYTAHLSKARLSPLSPSTSSQGRSLTAALHSLTGDLRLRRSVLAG